MKNFMKNKKEGITIFIISLIAFIIGSISVGLLKALIVIGIADIIYIVTCIKEKKVKPKSQNTKQNKLKPKTKSKGKKFFKILLIIFIIGMIIVMLTCSAFLFYVVKKAPTFNPDNLYSRDATIIYDINGKVIAKLGTEIREKITYDKIPDILVDAIIATEDSKYFEHNGFDLSRFLVASVKQVLTKSGGGASTLTMQISKKAYTSSEKSIVRKFTDIYMAIFQIEKNYTKQEIMEFYVNMNYLGSGSYGVEQACQTYFGKSVSDINLAEAALIAGLFQAPDAYDPYNHPELAEERRQTVLYLMKRHGYITDEEYNIALALPVEKLLKTEQETGDEKSYQAFVDTVVEEIVEDTKDDPYVVPMEIYTTLDTEKQSHIDSIMSGETFNWENDYVDAGISVIDVKTGAIVAVGAGRNRVGQRQYNNATMITKQIGSTSKPLYDYAPGIEYENWSTYKLFADEEYSYSNGTSISNWDRKYNGLMTMRTALAQSRNIPALKAFQSNKNSNIYNFVTSLGLSPEVEGNIVHEAHSIGGYTGENPLKMAVAYAAFGNGGYYITPHSYTKLVYRETDEVKEKEIIKKRVMSEETAYMMTSLLQSSAQNGLGLQANIGGAVFGAKTGTSNYDAATIKEWGYGPDAVNDLWVDGVSPDYAISVWYGYKTRTRGYTSTSYTISHRRLFQAVAKGIFKPGSTWTKPSGVTEVEVEYGSNPAALPSEFTPDNLKVKELFKSGTEPTDISTRFSKLSDVTNIKANLLDNKLKITWKEIETPDAISDSYLNSYFESLYTNENARKNAISERKSYNNSNIGSIVYKIYSKDLNGKLELVKTVDKAEAEIEITSTSPTTYIVKTSYTIFTANMSDGVEIKVNLDDIKTTTTSTTTKTNTSTTTKTTATTTKITTTQKTEE